MALATMLCACSLTAPDDASLMGGAAPSGSASSACALGTKPCPGGCAAVDAPATGCGAASCSPCSFAHAQPLCIAGACAMGPCENGFADCDHDPTNGCEADLRRDTGRCGSCFAVCTASSPACEDGVRHDDPALGIAWPLPVAFVSERDRAFELVSGRTRPLWP